MSVTALSNGRATENRLSGNGVPGGFGQKMLPALVRRLRLSSHCRVTPQMLKLLPRSTYTHCGSENALDHRVPVLPSKALPESVSLVSLLGDSEALFSAALVLHPAARGRRSESDTLACEIC